MSGSAVNGFFTPFEMPTGAHIPKRRVSITDFGAVPGGQVKNTKAFAAAIASLSAQGGGWVMIPAGKWLTGPIHLKSNIGLSTEEGTEVIFSIDKEDYLPAVFTLYEGVRCYTYSSQLYAKDCRDIAVTGKGTFNGRGYVWWYMAVERSGVEDLYAAGEAQRAVEERVYDTEAQGIRPGLLHFINCSNVTIDGPTFTFSPFWTVHPAWCQNIIIRNITVLNPWDHAPNTDACNLEGCGRGLVDGVKADTGDDAVCIKSGRDRDGRTVGIPCEDIIVRHVTALRSHGGVTVGSETSGGIRNILVEDCDLKNSLIGIWIKTARERGNVIEKLTYRNIRVGDVREQAVCITMGYYVDGNRPMPESNIPKVRHVSIDGLTCEKAGTGILLEGIQGHPLTDIRLKNIQMKNCRTNAAVKNVKDLYMESVSFES